MSKRSTSLGKRMNRVRDDIAKLIIAEFDLSPDDLFLWTYDPHDGAEVDFVFADKLYSVCLKRLR